MNANEAPEKIYLQDSMSTDTVGDLWPEWFDAKVSDNSIEYTRTDASIEKACGILNRMIWEVVYEDFEDNSTQHCDKNEFIEDFKKYMKGE